MSDLPPIPEELLKRTMKIRFEKLTKGEQILLTIRTGPGPGDIEWAIVTINKIIRDVQDAEGTFSVVYYDPPNNYERENNTNSAGQAYRILLHHEPRYYIARVVLPPAPATEYRA